MSTSVNALTRREALTEQEYRALPGLSYSGMKDLAVSPLRYWHKHINPDRPADEPTPEMQIGSAVHCAVLEPSEFDQRYACELIPPDECLDTMDQLRSFIRNCGQTPKGTRKDEVISQVQSINRDIPILQVLQAQHARENAGKVVFNLGDWCSIAGAAQALLNEPRLKRLLLEGDSEVHMFRTDPETGVQLKCRQDWVRQDVSVDLKTFKQKRGKSIDKSVTDAIFYEWYYGQAFTYSMMRGWPGWNGDFVLAFVESESPHEVRLRSLCPKVGGEVNLYWERARIEVRDLIRLYAECLAHFGDKPWRYAQEINPLADHEMPALSY